MSIFWKPNGTLDIATDPADLPEQSTGKDTSSTALARCKNLRLDRQGVISTRYGSSKLNSTAINSVRRIVEQAGDRYAFAGGTIYENESSIDTGNTDADWQAILYNAYNDTTQQVFALNGTDTLRIEGSTAYEWGITAPATAPTVAAGASTGLTGAYNAKYTYCRKVGSVVVCESDPSDAGTAAVTLSNGSLSITWTASSDSQVTHVRVYRTLADGGTYYHDQDVAIGTVTVDSDTADGSLGSEVSTDHDRPPAGTYVAGPNYNGTCFIAYNNLLYYCLPKQPEYWPATYYIEVSAPQFPIQCILFYEGQPYCITKHHIFHIQGTGHPSFFPFDMKAVTGCVNPDAAVAITGVGIAHVGSDGIYLYGNGRDKKLTQENFDPIFNGVTSNGVPAISSLTNCWLSGFRNKLYFGYTSSGYTYPTNMLVMNLDSQRTAYYSFGMEIRCLAHDKQNNRLLAGDNDGYVWVIESTTATDDGGTAISWEVETKEFALQTRAHFPRWCKFDVNAASSDTAYGRMILDGTTLQNWTLSENRNTRKRLCATGNGERMSVRIDGTGPVDIYALETE